MFTQLFRQYWYPGMKGYNFYLKHYKEKVVNYSELAFLDDPLDINQYSGTYDSVENTSDPITTIIDRIKFKQNVEISPNTVSWLCYNVSKRNISDPLIWKEIEFFIPQTMSLMNPRMVYGCTYGILKSNQGNLMLVESLIREFQEKCYPALDAYSCYEMIDALSHCKRTDFESTDFLHEFIVPKLERMWRKARFLHIDKHLLQVMINLASVEYFEQSIWNKLLGIIHKKKFKNVTIWSKHYELLQEFKKNGFEECSGISLIETLDKLENIWKNNVDFQWKYSLEHKRYHTVDELIEKARNTPSNLTWEEGEKYIMHNLPKWYHEADVEVDEEISELYDEYKKIQQPTKK